MSFIMSHLGWIGFAISEALGLFPGLKSSSVLQLVAGLAKEFVDAVSSPAPKV